MKRVKKFFLLCFLLEDHFQIDEFTSFVQIYSSNLKSDFLLRCEIIDVFFKYCFSNHF